MGFPIKRGAGGTEFAKIYHSTVFDVYPRSLSDGTWRKFQFDLLDENRNGDPTINAITQGNDTGPWGIAAVIGGDYWVTLSAKLRNGDVGGDDVQLDLGFYVDDVLRSSTGYLDTNTDDPPVLLTGYSAMLTLQPGEFVDARMRGTSVGKDIEQRPDLALTFLALTRIGATP